MCSLSTCGRCVRCWHRLALWLVSCRCLPRSILRACEPELLHYLARCVVDASRSAFGLCICSPCVVGGRSVCLAVPFPALCREGQLPVGNAQRGCRQSLCPRRSLQRVRLRRWLMSMWYLCPVCNIRQSPIGMQPNIRVYVPLGRVCVPRYLCPTVGLLCPTCQRGPSFHQPPARGWVVAGCGYVVGNCLTAAPSTGPELRGRLVSSGREAGAMRSRLMWMGNCRRVGVYLPQRGL